MFSFRQNVSQFLAVHFSDFQMSCHCFDWMRWVSGWYGYLMQPVRGAKNFNLHYIYSGNRRKVTSVFQLRLVGTSCANVAGCQMKFQAPLTSHKMVSAFSRTTTCILSNIWKTDDNKKRKMCWLELEHSVWKITLFQMQNNEVLNPTPFIINWYNKERQKTASLLNILNGCEI